MKNLTTTFALVLFVLFSSAQCEPSSVVNIKLTNDAPFKVFVDGRPFSRTTTRARIENFPVGKHFIQVYRVDKRYGYETLDNAYRGFISIAPGTENFISVCANRHELYFDHIETIHARPWNAPGQNPDICLYPVRPDRTNPTVIPIDDQVSCGPVPMGMVAFNGLKQSMANTPFESSKLDIFRQASSRNYFTSMQVRELMEVMNFESSKLELAKMAYERTLDPSNYYIVNDAFTFNSSIAHLGEYMAMR